MPRYPQYPLPFPEKIIPVPLPPNPIEVGDATVGRVVPIPRPPLPHEMVNIGIRRVESIPTPIEIFERSPLGRDIIDKLPILHERRTLSRLFRDELMETDLPLGRRFAHEGKDFIIEGADFGRERVLEFGREDLPELRNLARSSARAITTIARGVERIGGGILGLLG